MSSQATKETVKRIKLQRKRPNPLFHEWLQELYEEAKTKKSKLEPMLLEALTSLDKYPLPLVTGAECAILIGFDKRLCLFLDKRLKVYEELEQCKRSSQQAANAVESEATESSSDSDEKNSATSTIDPPKCSEKCLKKSRGKQKPIYKPSINSGGYALLLGLLEQSKENPDNPWLTKEELIVKAQKHSSESFTIPKPNTFYTAWSNMSRLLTKNLVQKSRGKKVEFSLTSQGVDLATIIWNESKNIPTVNDVIFNNAPSEAPVTESTVSANNGSMVLEERGNALANKELVHESPQCVNFTEMPAGTFDVILLIDKNETSGASKKNDPTVAQFNKYPDLKHEYRSLKVGDFTWVARLKANKDIEFVLPYVVERKRMDDLGASIKDGRFHEQKFRLRKCGLQNVIYLVENYGSNKHVGLPIPSLMQALANTRIQDGFKVHMTDSLTNTARFLAMMTKRLTIEFKDKKLKGASKDADGDTLMTFSYFNQASSKSKALTVTETFIKLLLQLKGMSVEKALAITRVFKTPRCLMKAYGEHSEEEGKSLLASLKYEDLSRNVGPTLSKSVYQLFTNIDLI